MERLRYVGITILTFVLGLTVLYASKPNPISTLNRIAWYELQDDGYRTVFQTTYVSPEGDVEDNTIQCPIPMKDRVRNYTGVQCVFASIETIGRWAEERKLIEPPLTSRPDCKSFSSPSDAASKLRQLNVKFEQTYRDRQAGLTLIRKAMTEGRGCLFGVPGHAMVLIHYDETNNVVKWIDNSDSTLKIQTTTISRFNQMWDTWVLVVYADNDIIPQKLGRSAVTNTFPILDPQNPEAKFLNEFVPFRASFQIR